jgi:glycosyltransferase involved in cell wall biosynthesis
MRNIILFDQDLQVYRQSLYRYFRDKLRSHRINLIVIYDEKLNHVNESTELFVGIKYSLFSFTKAVKYYRPLVVIQFVWLKYLHLLPFMIWSKIKNIKIILWSNGINIQNPSNKQYINKLYFLRQRLSTSYLLYTENQHKYFIPSTYGRRFVLGNTLNFTEFIHPIESKSELKRKYGFLGKYVVLTVGRLNTNRRDYRDIIQLSKNLPDEYVNVIIGPGINDSKHDELLGLEKIIYLGPIYDDKVINEYYKMSDIFFMPGMIGLAINHAFYFSSPVIYKQTNGESPEEYYFKKDINGYIYEDGTIVNLAKKITKLMSDDTSYVKMSEEAKNTIEREASTEKMCRNFINAVNYTILSR